MGSNTFSFPTWVKIPISGLMKCHTLDWGLSGYCACGTEGVVLLPRLMIHPECSNHFKSDKTPNKLVWSTRLNLLCQMEHLQNPGFISCFCLVTAHGECLEAGGQTALGSFFHVKFDVSFLSPLRVCQNHSGVKQKCVVQDRFFLPFLFSTWKFKPIMVKKKKKLIQHYFLSSCDVDGV